MFSSIHAKIQSEIAKAYIGDASTVSALIIAMLAGGHVLLEGIPGLAKTTLAKSLAMTLEADFSRVQFTMDLMPSDITGSNIYHIHNEKFEFIPGPVFTNILLADEINRAPARTQSALLEAMQENQVSVDGKTWPLPYPFFVIATQNGSDERGTWPLPESELDRFMFRIRLGYPTPAQEQQIVMLSARPEPQISPVISVQDFEAIQGQLMQVHVSPEIASYIAGIIRQTRQDPEIQRGASPRAGALMLKAARSCAFVSGSEFVTPDHVRQIAPLILNHRLILRSESSDVDDVIRHILSTVPFR